ncbi:MAG: Dabb family protein [Ktedonobacteraceae bacterium]|nr:Dabb family protein [Ktedonobacteraceae bacterium]
MIIHVALYRFRSDAPEEQVEACIRELQSSTRRTGLASWYLSGAHLPLPADQTVRDMVYDFAALWGFADQQALDEFSRHPVIAQCVAMFIQPILNRLAIVNFIETSDAHWQLAGIEEQKHVS